MSSQGNSVRPNEEGTLILQSSEDDGQTWNYENKFTSVKDAEMTLLAYFYPDDAMNKDEVESYSSGTDSHESLENVRLKLLSVQQQLIDVLEQGARDGKPFVIEDHHERMYRFV